MCTYIIVKEMFDELLKLPELWGTTSSPNNSLWRLSSILFIHMKRPRQCSINNATQKLIYWKKSLFQKLIKEMLLGNLFSKELDEYTLVRAEHKVVTW